MVENRIEQITNDIRHHSNINTKSGQVLHPQVQRFHRTLLRGAIKHLDIKREKLKGI